MCEISRQEGSSPVIVVAGPLSFRSGGIARSAALQADMLRTLGYEPFLVGTCGPALPLDENELGRRVGHVLAFAVDAPDDVPRDLLDEVDALLDSCAAVLLNGHWRPLNVAVAARCRQAGVPYVVSSRNELSRAFRAARSTLSPAEIAAEAELLEGASFVHMTSSIEARGAIFPGAVPRRVEVAPNPVEVDAAWTSIDRGHARRSVGIDEGTRLLLSYGRVVAEKNPTWPLRVLAELSGDVSLAYVGPASSDQQADLVALARSLGVADRVLFRGYVSGDARAHWLRAADVFLLPSFSENFGLALVEAVACGTPAISSPFVGALEFLPPEAVVVEELDVGRWAERCRQAFAGAMPTTGRVVPELTLVAATERWRVLLDDLRGPPADRCPRVPDDADATATALTAWAQERLGVGPLRTSSVPADAGGRCYVRLHADGERTWMAMALPDRGTDYLAVDDPEEELVFLMLGQFLAERGWPVPEILHCDTDRDWFVIEDLGDVLLAHVDGEPRGRAHYLAAVELVVRLQALTDDLVRSGSIVAVRTMDVETLHWELWHGFDWIVGELLGRRVDPDDRTALDEEFLALSSTLGELPRVLTHRDFHSRNLLVTPDRGVRVIDFQDAVLANPVYDLASLLFDSYVDLDPALVDACIDEFARTSRRAGGWSVERPALVRLVELQALQRAIKVAGRFVWLAHERGQVERIGMLPPILDRVRDLLGRHHDALQGIGAIFDRFGFCDAHAVGTPGC